MAEFNRMQAESQFWFSLLLSLPDGSPAAKSIAMRRSVEVLVLVVAMVETKVGFVGLGDTGRQRRRREKGPEVWFLHNVIYLCVCVFVKQNGGEQTNGRDVWWCM